MKSYLAAAPRPWPRPQPQGAGNSGPTAWLRPVSPSPAQPSPYARPQKTHKTVGFSIDSLFWPSTASIACPIAVPGRKSALAGLTFSRNEPWSVSILPKNAASSRFPGMLQCRKMSNRCYSDRLTDTVAATVTVTAAVTAIAGTAARPERPQTVGAAARSIERTSRPAGDRPGLRRHPGTVRGRLRDRIWSRSRA